MTPEEFRGYRVSLEECNRLLARAALPGAVSLARFPTGEVNASFLVELVDGARAVLRVNIRSGSPERLFIEREACALVRAAGVPAPEVLAVDASREVLPYCCAFLAWLPGRDARDVFGEFDAAQRGLLVRSLGRRLAQLHAVTVPTTEAPAMRWDRSAVWWVRATDAEFHWCVAQHRTRGFIGPALLDRAEAVWEELRPHLGRGRRCLLHGDSNFANAKVIPPDPEVSALFDFDQAEVGEAESDFAPMETLRPQGWEEGLREEFYAGYTELRPLAVGCAERTKLYALLRDLRIMWSYQGPVAGPHAEGSRVQTVARLLGAG